MKALYGIGPKASWLVILKYMEGSDVDENKMGFGFDKCADCCYGGWLRFEDE
ncbi:hypothetical protein JCM10914_3255 [Paenibacillus sp. JCM 10914]|nr:hypothetical protein JCM10914_3255 [Paenibacillus sp. JCM 10914]